METKSQENQAQNRSGAKISKADEMDDMHGCISSYVLDFIFWIMDMFTRSVKMELIYIFPIMFYVFPAGTSYCSVNKNVRSVVIFTSDM